MRAATLSLLLVLVAIVAPVSAQSSLKEEQKAVLVFDLRMDMLNSSPLGQQMKFNDLLSKAQKQSVQTGADPSKVVRMFGAVGAPQSVAELQGVEPGGEIPFEFFMRAKYQDSQSATEAMNATLEQGADSIEKMEKNGHTFHKSTAGGVMPAGLLMHQVDETTIEIGTEAYVFHPDRQVFTDNLKTAWSKAPNEAIRMAMDLQGAKALVSELVEEGKSSAPPPVEVYLDLIGTISHMGVSIDLTGENLLSVRATALDSDQGQDLKDALDSLLFTAKAGGQQFLPTVELMAPEMKPVVESILGSLEAKKDGADVSIKIPKPNGFEDAIGAFAASGALAALSAGPPEGFGGEEGFGDEEGFGSQGSDTRSPSEGSDTKAAPAEGSGSRDEGSGTKSAPAEGSDTKAAPSEGSGIRDEGSTTKSVPAAEGSGSK